MRYFGHTDLEDQALALEMMAREEKLDGADGPMHCIQREADRLIQALSEYLRTGSPPEPP